jgi:hypothetical protein
MLDVGFLRLDEALGRNSNSGNPFKIENSKSLVSDKQKRKVQY